MYPYTKSIGGIMVNVLLLSHSHKLAEGLKELCEQMAPNVNIDYVGGTEDGEIGSNFEKINEKVNNLTENGNELIVFFDLGSSMMNAQMAIEMLGEDTRKRVKLADNAIVEEAIQTTVMLEGGSSFEEMCELLDQKKYNKL